MNLSKFQNILNLKCKKYSKIFFYFAFALMLNIFSINSLYASPGINTQIPYSGTIIKNNGTILSDGTYRAKFILYPNSAPTISETPIYEEIRDGSTTYSGIVSPLLSISDGKFDILLGSQNTGISSINDDSLWLELQLDADGNGSYEETFLPRKRIGSAMSAINSLRLVAANGGADTDTLSLDIAGNVVATSLGGVASTSITSGYDRVLLANSSGQFSQAGFDSLGFWRGVGNPTTDAWNGSTGTRLGTTSTQPLVLATTNATAQDIRFFTGANGASERMRILGTGNIGIGATIPAAKLDVNTNALVNPTINATYAQSGISLSNSTVATTGNQQFSPTLRWRGSGFATTPVAGLDTSFVSYLQPVQGTTAPSANLIFASSINNSSYTTRLTLNSSGALTVGGGLIATTGTFTSSISATTGTFTAAISSTTTLTNTRNNIITTSTDGIINTNTTASTSAVPVQISPRLRLSGTAWNTGGTPASNTMNWAIENIPTSGNPPTSSLRFNFDRNGLGYTTTFRLLSDGGIIATSLGGVASTSVTSGYDRVLLANSSGQFSQAGFDSLGFWRGVGNPTTDAWNGSTGTRLGTTSTQPLVLATTNATAQDIRFFTGANGASERMRILGTGNIGIGTINPTARLQLAAGTSSANTAPLKLTAGTNLTTPEAGAIEWDGTNLFLTKSGDVRQTINQGLTATTSLDFPSTAVGAVSNLTLTVTGADINDVVSLGVPNGSVPVTGDFSAWVSAANTVTVRYTNNSTTTAQDPEINTFKVFVTKF
jgi:hypothetical protein